MKNYANKLEIKNAIDTKDKEKLELLRKHYEKDYEEYMKQQESNNKVIGNKFENLELLKKEK